VLTKYFDYMIERARAIVRTPLLWAQIEAVADALLERGSLSGKQVRDIRRDVYTGCKHSAGSLTKPGTDRP
jgi:hypothetical protein